MSDEVDFLHVDKYESFLQIDAIIFNGDGQAFPKLPKWQACSVFTIYLKKEVRDEVDFLLADKHQSFLQHDTIIIDGYD